MPSTAPSSSFSSSSSCCCCSPVLAPANREEGDGVAKALTLKNCTTSQYSLLIIIPLHLGSKATTATFSTVTNTSDELVLTTAAGLELTLSLTVPTVALAVNGTSRYREIEPFQLKSGKDCIPALWHPLDKGQAASLSAPFGTTCIRHTRSLAEGTDIYGFGQVTSPNSVHGCARAAIVTESRSSPCRSNHSPTRAFRALSLAVPTPSLRQFPPQVPQENLSAVGTSMLLATSSANLGDGQSHAPAPFFIDVAADGSAHGMLLATTRYSMYDIGETNSSELRVHTGDPVLDYFLLAGPTPAAVLRQLGELCGLPPQPPPWALGFKYHTQNQQSKLVSPNQQPSCRSRADQRVVRVFGVNYRPRTLTYITSYSRNLQMNPK